MPLLVARSAVGGLGFEDLAFSVSEIQNLYLQNHRVVLSEPDAAELAHTTEGWITGLVLSTDIENGRVTTRLQGRGVTGVGLYEYLAQQVLEHQRDEVKQFLFRSSLLEEFDAERCAAVIGKGLGIEANWSALMDDVQRNNLFTLPIIEDHLWLRYHHLFRDFLQNQMTRLYPEETRKIYLQLVNYHQQKRDWERAYQVTIRLGEEEMTSRLVEQAGSSMISQGRLLTLKTWIESLPERLANGSPGLLSIHGTVMMMLGNPEIGIHLTSRALDLVEEEPDIEIQATTLVRRSLANRMAGYFQQAVEDANRAIDLTLSHPNQRKILAGAFHAKGAAFQSAGKLVDARDSLQKARDIFNDAGFIEGATKAGLDLGMVLRYLGYFSAAEAIYREVLSYYQTTGNVVWQANLLNNLGVLHTLIGEYETALEELESAIDYARMGGNQRLEAYALTSIGDLFQDINSSSEAKEVYRKAAEIDAQIEDQFLHFYLSYTEAELAVNDGSFTKAQTALDEAEQLAVNAGSAYESHLCNLLKGRMAIEIGRFPLAVETLKESLEFFITEGHIVEANRSRLLLAAASVNADEFDLARSVLNYLASVDQNPEFNHLVMSEAHLFAIVMDRPEIPYDIRLHIDKLALLSVQVSQKLPGVRKQLRRQSQIVHLSPPELSIITFGKTQVKIGDHLITGAEWMSQNARDLLLLLAFFPEGMTKEEIGEIFWLDSTPAELKLRFKNTIYRLRHAAGKDVVLFDNEIYTFNRGMDYEADFENFTNNLNQARRAVDEEARITLLKEAVKIYKGYFAPDISEHWAITERERFHQMAMDAMVQLAELQLKRGELGEMLVAAQTLLDFEPTHETMVCLAMRALAAAGNIVAVMQQYDQFRKILHKEMDAQPSPQTRALYENLTRERRVIR
ncbi:MAG: BTAD domain-containing putative transcriptional regulator [Bellilinea sp.]